MTICIAVICDKNKDPKVILAGDRMITGSHLSIEFEYPEPKLIQLTNNCAVATAGDALAHTELFSIVKNELSLLRSPQIAQIVECIKDSYVKVRMKRIQDLYLRPKGIDDIRMFYNMQRNLMPEIVMTLQNEIDNYDYGLQILIGGVDHSGPHIYCIYNPGMAVPFSSLGYHAIGSGTPHAISTFISSDYSMGCPYEEALYVTYKSKKISENAPGVGSRNTDIWLINRDNIIAMDDNVRKQLDAYYNAENKYKINYDALKKMFVPMEKEAIKEEESLIHVTHQTEK